MAESFSAGPELIEGWVDGCVQGVVRGWAWRPAAPAAPVTIEILIEGVIAAEGVARLKRADLELVGKSACGFEIPVELGRLAAPTAQMEVRVKNGGPLPGGDLSVDLGALLAADAAMSDRPVSSLPVLFGGGLGGYLDEFGPDWIAGWVYDPEDPAAPVDFEIWEGGSKLATVTGDIWRVDLQEMRGGDGRWGFAALLPPVLQDDAVHEIDLRRASTGRSALAEPVRFHLPKRDKPEPPATAAVRPENAGTVPAVGWVDGCDLGVVRGWARRPAAPSQPVTIEILVDGAVIGQGVAGLKRADLELTGQGACGFEIAIEYGRLEASTVEATVRVKDGAALSGGPVMIDIDALRARDAAPDERSLTSLPVRFGDDAGLHGYLDAFGPDRLGGWIFDPADPSPPVAFEIWEAGRKLATVTADIWRVDLQEMRQGDGRWGYRAPVPPELQDDAVHEIDLRLAASGASILAEPLRLYIPNRDGIEPPPPPRPARDLEAVSSSWTRPLHRAAPAEPLFTIIVNFYNMRREAQRTLTSLSRAYQREIGDLRYEVLCIDNGSKPPLDPDWIASFGPEFRLIRPSRVLPSPCAAINEAARAAAGRYLAIMIDGAYVLTPGVLRAAWDALVEAPNAVVALRQWFIGGDQRWLAQVGYSRRQEDMLFDKIAWPRDGYDLFRIGTPARESPNNWFDGMIESNCLFVPAALYQDIGGMNEGFAEAGAGFANLDLFMRAAEAVGEPLVALLGEASFHQFHGGTTTNIPLEEMEKRVRTYDETYFQLVGRNFTGIEPVDLHLRGQFRIGYGAGARQKPLSPARIGVTDRVRQGVQPLHFDDRAADYAQSAYVECGLHNGTKWLGHALAIAPADVLNIQDIIHETRPERIIAVNVAHGVLVLLDSLLRVAALDGARIVSISGTPAETSLPASVISVTGDPLAPEVLAATAHALDAEEHVLVLYAPRVGDHFPIDALRAYARFVSCRSYLIFLGSVFGQPWLGYSKNWFQKAIRILANEGPFVIDYSRNQHLITTCPMGYLQRTGGLVAVTDDDELADALSDE